MTTPAFRLGDRVTIRAVLERIGLIWERRELDAPMVATVVGKRTLWDSAWEMEEYGPRYIDHFRRPVPAYLVAPDLRQIVRVAPEDVEYPAALTFERLWGAARDYEPDKSSLDLIQEMRDSWE